jgi:hypothetical protein
MLAVEKSLKPIPASMSEIDREPLIFMDKIEKIRVEARRLGVKPVFCNDVYSRDYGKLLGVR